MAGSISTLGVGSGLQLQDILDKLRAVDQGVVDRKKGEVTKYETQLEELTTVKNKLLTMKSAALNLALAGSFIGRTISSSEESAVTATVTDGATVKSSAVTVNHLAQKSSWLSTAGFTSADSVVVPAGQDQPLIIQVGEDELSLTVTANSTLSQLAEQINTATDNPGVTATIINDGIDPDTPYKLALSANDTGEDHRITVLTQLPGVVMAEQADQVAADSLNAQFTVDSILYQRQTNTVNDVLSGVSMTFKGTGSSTVAVASNDAGLKEKITALVTSYNDVVQEVKDKSGYDTESESYGVLAKTTLRGLPFELEGLLTATNKADQEGNIQSLFDLGLEFDREGSITINDTILTAAISEHGAGVQSFFLGDTENEIVGLADTINDRLRTMTSSTGIVESEKSATQTRIDDLNDHIEIDNARLDKKYSLLTKQFVALDSYMSEMTSMSNFLTGQFKSLSDGWANTSSSSD